ncbi:hypothetical protein BRC2024_EJDNWAKA_CDS_0020 [Acinetobacter phage vB_AbaP_Fanak]
MIRILIRTLDKNSPRNSSRKRVQGVNGTG